MLVFKLICGHTFVLYLIGIHIAPLSSHFGVNRGDCFTNTSLPSFITCTMGTPGVLVQWSMYLSISSPTIFEQICHEHLCYQLRNFCSTIPVKMSFHVLKCVKRGISRSMYSTKTENLPNFVLFIISILTAIPKAQNIQH